jgi:hypothetical protein
MIQIEAGGEILSCGVFCEKISEIKTNKHTEWKLKINRTKDEIFFIFSGLFSFQLQSKVKNVAWNNFR